MWVRLVWGYTPVRLPALRGSMAPAQLCRCRSPGAHYCPVLWKELESDHQFCSYRDQPEAPAGADPLLLVLRRHARRALLRIVRQSATSGAGELFRVLRAASPAEC